MNFPENITFKLVDIKTRRSIKNIATLLILYAHKKNNYSVGIKISNNSGLIHFNKEECLHEIKKFKKAYIMDYFSDLEQCLPKVSLQIISPDQIDYIAERRKSKSYVFKNYWRSDKRFIKQLESSDNAKYISRLYTFTEKKLWHDKIITIGLERRDAENSKSGAIPTS